jgi:hypothetical protein
MSYLYFPFLHFRPPLAGLATARNDEKAAFRAFFWWVFALWGVIHPLLILLFPFLYTYMLSNTSVIDPRGGVAARQVVS